MHAVTYAGREVLFAGQYTGSYACITRGQFYEQPLLDYIRGLNLQGTYLDVGTNIGNHALFFALFCSCSRVIGFEPMASWRAIALQNLKINGCGDRVDVMPVGLMEVPGLFEFNPYGRRHLIECTTLDAVLSHLSGVSFVKMDIEGNEPRALRGGKQFFTRNRPVIIAECLGNVGELCVAAEEIGYILGEQVLPGLGLSPMYELVPGERSSPGSRFGGARQMLGTQPGGT